MKNKLLLLCLIILAPSTFAQTFTVGNLTYSVMSTTDKTVQVSDGKNSIGDVNIPETINYNDVEYSVTTIGGSAFSGCTQITSVILAKSVTKVAGKSFMGCKGLTSIVIPNSVKSIGTSAFEDCINLVSVVIGESVEELKDNAFSDCSKIKNIYSLNSAPPFCGSNVFDGLNMNQIMLYVPKGSKEFYAKATQWKDFICIIEDIENEDTKKLKSRIEELELENTSLKTQISTLTTENAALQTELDEYSKKVVNDINGDNKVTIADVTTLIDIIVNK